MKGSKNDFLRDFKEWVLDAPDGIKIVRYYNKGLITLPEAIRLLNEAHTPQIKLIKIN